MSDTYTFDSSLPAPKDRIRFRVGDINGQPQWFLADETYDALAVNYSEDEAAAQAAETIGAICAQLAVRVVQRSLQVYYQNRSQEMYQLADRIRNLAAPAPGAPANYGAAATKMITPDLHEYERLTGQHDDHHGQTYDPLFDR